MWQEARKQEKLIRGVMVDHKRRAERRREYYEKIRQDPTQFLQIHGRPIKISLDPAVAAAANGPGTMMPWQGDKSILIDRFDARAHLDFIPDIKSGSISDPENEPTKENRALNYERYKILIQNQFLKVPEDKFLKTIELEEKFGGKTYSAQKAKEDKKKAKMNKAAIGFVYNDSTDVAKPVPDNLKVAPKGGPQFADAKPKSQDSDSDSEIDLDVSLNFTSLSMQNRLDLNSIGKDFRLTQNDFMEFLSNDHEEQQRARQAKQLQQERTAHAGRRSRKERRQFREQRLMARRFSPPKIDSMSSFDDLYQNQGSESESESSRSPSPKNKGQVEFITSFGADSDSNDGKEVQMEKSGVSASQRAKLKKLRNAEDEVTPIVIGPTLPLSSSVSSKTSRKRYGRSRSSSRSRSPKHRRRSRSRHRTRSRSRSRRRYRKSRSRSRGRRGSRGSHSRSRRRGRRSRSRRRYSSASDRSRSHSRSRGRDKRKSSRDRYDSRKQSPSRHRRQSRSMERTKNSTRSTSRSSSNRSRSSSTSSKSEQQNDEKALEIVEQAPVVPVKRYYERIKQKIQDDDELSDLTDVDENDGGPVLESTSVQLEAEPNRDDNSQETTESKVSAESSTSSKVKDKIRKRMQAQIRRQFKLDKKAEEDRKRKLEEERISREEEMKELALKLRKKEREKRHQRRDDSDSSDSDNRSRHSRSPRRRSRTRSRSRSPAYRSSRRRSRSRSREREKSHGRLKLVDY